jgi:hypothetical protein
MLFAKTFRNFQSFKRQLLLATGVIPAMADTSQKWVMNNLQILKNR